MNDNKVANEVCPSPESETIKCILSSTEQMVEDMENVINRLSEFALNEKTIDGNKSGESVVCMRDQAKSIEARTLGCLKGLVSICRVMGVDL